MKSKVLDRIMKRIPLETKLCVAFQASDIENWKEGEYFGDAEKYVSVAMEEIEEHIKEKFPDIDIEKLILYNK